MMYVGSPCSLPCGQAGDRCLPFLARLRSRASSHSPSSHFSLCPPLGSLATRLSCQAPASSLRLSAKWLAFRSTFDPRRVESGRSCQLDLRTPFLHHHSVTLSCDGPSPHSPPARTIQASETLDWIASGLTGDDSGEEAGAEGEEEAVDGDYEEGEESGEVS